MKGRLGRREFLKAGATSALGTEWIAGRARASGCAERPSPAPAETRAQTGSQWDVSPAEYMMERANTAPGSTALVKSIGDAAEYVLRWRLPADAEAWRMRRPVVEAALRKEIGLEKLPERNPLQARVVARHEMQGYVLENVWFESRPGFPVCANVYRPKSPPQGKQPAIVSPIGHYIAAGKGTSFIQSRCIKLAQMGFVVLVYDAIGHGERMTAGNNHHDAGFALLPLGETIAGWMVWDTMRAIDYLLTLKEVDPGRIGVTGNSGGGLNTYYTAALDERVRAAAVVGYTFQFHNWLKYGTTHCTCTHLPGQFRAMEWFEVAGLIAPRALMMLQGERDDIFLLRGARQAGHETEALYALLGRPEQARFCMVPDQPHAYSRPYRERMYGWMAFHLLGQGNGEPIPEGDVQPLDENDPRLLCDSKNLIITKSPSVVDIARKRAMETVLKQPARKSSGERRSVRKWVKNLTSPPETLPDELIPQTAEPVLSLGGRMEKLSFASEDGEYIPGLLWMPEGRSSKLKTIVVVADGGKAAVAESGFIQPLLNAGFAVFSADLRGRGETRGYFGPGWDTNFRLATNQIQFGRPLPGRRAFDLWRALDYLALREELLSERVVVVGVGDEAPAALFAAVADPRIAGVAVAGYFHSFISQMKARPPRPKSELLSEWNAPQSTGRLKAAEYVVDFGSVTPSVLVTADLPDLLALIAPRSVLFCDARDNRSREAEGLALKFQRVVESAGTKWISYYPGEQLSGKLLLEWLRQIPLYRS